MHNWKQADLIHYGNYLPYHNIFHRARAIVVILLQFNRPLIPLIRKYTNILILRPETTLNHRSLKCLSWMEFQYLGWIIIGRDCFIHWLSNGCTSSQKFIYLNCPSSPKFVWSNCTSSPNFIWSNCMASQKLIYSNCTFSQSGFVRTVRLHRSSFTSLYVFPKVHSSNLYVFLYVL